MRVSANYETDRNLRARQSIWKQAGTRPLAERVIDLVDPPAGATVVDVGCGNGTYLAELRRRGHHGALLGLDLSRGMARVAATHAVTGVADAQSLPVRTAAARITLAPHMLYHVPDIALALAEIRRITAPGGRAVIVTNSTDHAHEVLALVTEVAGDLLGRPVSIAWDTRRFRTGRADAMLPSVFRAIDKRDLSRVAPVPSGAAIRDYVASLPTSALAVPDERRGEILAEIERRASARVAARGAFAVTSGATAYLCE